MRFILDNLRNLSITSTVLKSTTASVPSVASSNLPEPKTRTDVFQNVSKTLLEQREGRTFAVVQLCGKQFKVTAGDIILVDGYWPPENGDVVRLEKVLLAGCEDFTLIGRPLLEQDTVKVVSTVIEKTLSHTKTHFRKKRRKQYQRINFLRVPRTMLRINSIDINMHRQT